MRYFDYEKLSNQRLKNIFQNNFSIWARVYIGGGYTHMVDFTDWLGHG